jgi:acyl-CoA synthetase (NDP forming)
MIASVENNPLYSITHCRNIVFFGASNNFSAMGTIIFFAMKTMGFAGPIYPIHPKENIVQGIKAYRDVQELPEVPDLAVIVLPTRLVCQALDQCGRIGIRHAVVVSGGFREVGDEGAALQDQLVSIAGRWGIRIIGPNCIGVVNTHHRLNTTPFLYEGPKGFIGLASQSGSFVAQMFQRLMSLGIGFSTAFSVGNEANTDIVDCLSYLGSCPDTKVIGLYIEGIRRGKAFAETARSITPFKPIVAYYVGGTETGKRAGFSHTGAMAGPDELYDGIFRQHGIIRARSITEMFDYCWVLGSMPLPKDNRVVIQTHSGGPGAAAADECGRAELRTPLLAKETIDKLSPYMPYTGSINNPVDITYAKQPLDYFHGIPQALLDDPDTDMMLMYILMPNLMVRKPLEAIGLSPEQAVEESGKIIDSQAENIVKLWHDSGKPLLGYTFRSLEEQFTKKLLEKGIPVFPDPARAARALRVLYDYGRIRKKIDSIL